MGELRGGPAARGRYHHGDLAAALVETGADLLAETGLAGFSVAELARRVGVSTAAPYRHFADRDRLLAAVATRIAAELAEALQRAGDAAGADPRERLAAVAEAYVVFVAAHRVGFDAIYAPSLRPARDEELAEAGRAVMAAWMEPASAVAGAGALTLVEQVVVLAHGYATLDAEGFLSHDRVTDEPTAVRARRAARALIDGATSPAG